MAHSHEPVSDTSEMNVGHKLSGSPDFYFATKGKGD